MEGASLRKDLQIPPVASRLADDSASPPGGLWYGRWPSRDLV
jgi:hypothetical protein